MFDVDFNLSQLVTTTEFLGLGSNNQRMNKQ
jgi:hypothetical protein